MKKLIITLEYPPQIGGVAIYSHQFAREFNPDEVVVLAPYYKDAKSFDEKEKFKTIRKNILLPIFIWPRWLKLFFQLLFIVKKEKIEIIHLHNTLELGGAVWLIKKIKKIPYLIFSHGTDLEYGANLKMKRKFLTKVLNETEQIVFNSENLKKRLLKVLPEYVNKASVLYPCPEQMFYQSIDTEEVNKLKAQYALEGKKVMLTVADFEEGKGYTHLIRMFPKILERIPNLVWFIVGDGPKKDFLIDEIQKRSLQSVVRFIGQIPHEELNKFYHLADLFVLLTHPDEGREEGLGLVFLEAAAAGLPVVAGKSGGVEEAVIHTQTGILVDIYKGDNYVVESIVKMFKDEEYAKRLAENAKSRVQADFKWESQLKVIEKWL
ncbi:glycosyltransferase family 4 protein [Patescibacteria group bacterium]|nr:glycosyltransferase family 4 protein [Patescibacteria group bacterium]